VFVFIVVSPHSGVALESIPLVVFISRAPFTVFLFPISSCATTRFASGSGSEHAITARTKVIENLLLFTACANLCRYVHAINMSADPNYQFATNLLLINNS
jgi:hypothetical protein